MALESPVSPLSPSHPFDSRTKLILCPTTATTTSSTDRDFSPSSFGGAAAASEDPLRPLRQASITLTATGASVPSSDGGSTRRLASSSPLEILYDGPAK